MKLFRRIRAYIRLRKNQRFLKKHGVSNWRQYNYAYDPDCVFRASEVNQYYNGYPYIHHFENVPPLYSSYRTWILHMKEWCDTNCSGKYRYDIHRVVREKGLIHNEYNDTVIWTDTEKFILNDIGGYDVLFFVFKNEVDAIMFVLRWS